jgi:hypothetical protein
MSVIRADTIHQGRNVLFGQGGRQVKKLFQFVFFGNVCKKIIYGPDTDGFHYLFLIFRGMGDVIHVAFLSPVAECYQTS